MSCIVVSGRYKDFLMIYIIICVWYLLTAVVTFYVYVNMSDDV